MRSETTPTDRGVISELAVRDALGRQGQSAYREPKAARPRTGGPRRRWSVAKLIAAAAVRPPEGRLGH